MNSDNGTPSAAIQERLRIDRWLWCTRLYKTRSSAADAVKGAHVRLNGQRVKPSHDVKIGDSLRVWRGHSELEVIVKAIPSRRGPAPEAMRCYAETPESAANRQRLAEQRASAPVPSVSPTRGRPDKRTRRLLRVRRSLSAPER